MKKCIGILFLFCIAVSFSGCSGQAEPGEGTDTTAEGPLTPPLPVLTVEDTPVPFQLGTYSWREHGRGVAVDTVDPPTLVKSLDPVTVRPNAVLNVSFTDAPSEIQAGIWKDGVADFQPVSDGEVTLPSEEGTYVYVLYASWPEGDATYAFQIHVTRLITGIEPFSSVSKRHEGHFLPCFSYAWSASLVLFVFRPPVAAIWIESNHVNNKVK